MNDAWIGLGSNIGDRRSAIFEALERIDELDGVSVARVSTILESTPVDVEDQPDFANAVARIRTELPPEALLALLLRVEQDMGRTRAGAIPRGPRSIDLDLLFHGDLIMEAPTLVLPHPRLHERAFVLLPMVELAPDFRHPAIGRTMQELLAADIEARGPVEGRCRPLPPDSLRPHEDEEFTA